jgi:ATP-dependent DNA helicase RecG
VSIDRPESELLGILAELRKLPRETEWAEFKHNNAEPDEIGEYLSALANAAALTGKVSAWLVWGVHNDTHEVIGTTFNPAAAKVGNEELESWLLRLLSRKINFRFYLFQTDDKSVVLLEISAAFRHPVQFKGAEFIRVGSYNKKLKGFPEKERELWRVFDRTPFEKEIAAENIAADEVLRLLDYPAYFDLLSLPLPEGRDGILSALATDDIIAPGKGGKWHITNLGAVLFAKRLADFRTLTRKAVPMFPELAIRELVANATLRERFGIDEKNSSMVSRIIKDTVEAGLIRCHDETVGSRARKYLPRWA